MEPGHSFVGPVTPVFALEQSIGWPGQFLLVPKLSRKSSLISPRVKIVGFHTKFAFIPILFNMLRAVRRRQPTFFTLMVWYVIVSIVVIYEQLNRM